MGPINDILHVADFVSKHIAIAFIMYLNICATYLILTAGVA